MDQKVILPISKGKLKQGRLAGKVAVATGAGRGIGYEAARSLSWLGAKSVIAEIDPVSGRLAAERISAEMGPGAARFVQTDVANEESVKHLASDVLKTYGRVDIVLNNACAFILAAVKDTSIADWDSVFFRQWMIRDFKKNAGMPMDEWLVKLQELESAAEKQGNVRPLIEAQAKLQQLDGFYDHLVDAQRGYQKDPAKREEGEGEIRTWQEPVRRLLSLIQSH